MIEALVIFEDGNWELVGIPEHDDGEQLEVLQEAVGGYIEGVSSSIAANWHAYVDEEGKLKGKPINMGATILARQLGWDSIDILVGPAVFLSSDEEGFERSVPQSVVDEWRRISSHQDDGNQ